MAEQLPDNNLAHTTGEQPIPTGALGGGNRRVWIAAGAAFVVCVGVSVWVGSEFVDGGKNHPEPMATGSAGAGDPADTQELGSRLGQSASAIPHPSHRVSSLPVSPSIAARASSVVPTPSVSPSGGKLYSQVVEEQFAGDPTATGNNPDKWHNGELVTIVRPQGTGYKVTRIGYHDPSDPSDPVHWSDPITGTRLIKPAFMRTGPKAYDIDVQNECDAAPCETPIVAFSPATDAVLPLQAFEPRFPDLPN